MLTEVIQLMDVKLLTGLVVFILLIGGVFFVVQLQTNPVQWWHFIASKGQDGSERGDINKLGQVVGIATSSWAIMVEAYSQHLEPFLLTAYLAYVGGVAGYSAYLRSKMGDKDVDSK